MTLDALMVHRADIKRRKKRQALAFTAGAVEVAAGDEVLGATSGAKATVHEVKVSSGTWAGGDAAGVLTVGEDGDQIASFTAGEPLTVGGSPVATFGSIGDYETLGGEFEYYYEKANETPTRCRIYTSAKRMYHHDTGEYTRKPSKCYFPSGTDIREGDIVTSADEGFASTYKVVAVYTAFSSMPEFKRVDMEALP